MNGREKKNEQKKWKWDRTGKRIKMWETNFPGLFFLFQRGKGEYIDKKIPLMVLWRKTHVQSFLFKLRGFVTARLASCRMWPISENIYLFCKIETIHFFVHHAAINILRGRGKETICFRKKWFGRQKTATIILIYSDCSIVPMRCEPN